MLNVVCSDRYVFDISVYSYIINVGHILEKHKCVTYWLFSTESALLDISDIYEQWTHRVLKCLHWLTLQCL